MGWEPSRNVAGKPGAGTETQAARRPLPYLLGLPTDFAGDPFSRSRPGPGRRRWCQPVTPAVRTASVGLVAGLFSFTPGLVVLVGGPGPGPAGADGGIVVGDSCAWQVRSRGWAPSRLRTLT